MQHEPLDALSRAWHAASALAGGGLPTLAQVARAGADIAHPGRALLGIVRDPSGRRTEPTYRFLDAGPDHALMAGHAMTGRQIDEIAHPAHFARIVKLYGDILAAGEPHDWRCINLARNAPPSRYRRVLVPVADDAGDGRCLFGIWVWDRDAGGAAEEAA